MNSSLKYRADIDGLRAVAVLAVVVFHAFPSLITGGFIGVDIFFVISGFLISTILFKKSDSNNYSISDFYSRRVRRIFPALFAVLFVTLAYSWFVLYPDELKQLGLHTSTSTIFVQNIMLWTESGYFDTSSETKPLLHIWSLGIEEQFYILWPIILLLAVRVKDLQLRKNLYLFSAVLVFVVSFTLNILSIKNSPSSVFYLPQYRLWELAAGSILAWVVLYNPKNVLAITENKYFSQSISLVSVSALFTAFFSFNSETLFPGVAALVPVLASVLIIFVGMNSYFNSKILANKFMVWVGLISYPLYLWHWPILSFGYIKYGDALPIKYSFVAIFLSIFIAWLTLKFIESPVRASSRRGVVTFLCGLIFGLGLAGFFISTTDGEFGRTKIQKRKNNADMIGSSNKWFEGKENWLFLGNAYDATISKLKLTRKPFASDIESEKIRLENIVRAGEDHNIQVALLIGPNKSTIYPEYLPDNLEVSNIRYVNYFTEELKAINGLYFCDPSDYLKSLKESEGLLYWKTDTHWNAKGAYFSYSALMETLNYEKIEVEFLLGEPYQGDIITIAELVDYPLATNDNWMVLDGKEIEKNVVFKTLSSNMKDPFGDVGVTINTSPLINKSVWVVGDSFNRGLRKYLNATFSEVHYLGHWSTMLTELPALIEKSVDKPDLILIERVERSF